MSIGTVSNVRTLSKVSHVLRADSCDNFRITDTDAIMDFSAFLQLQADFSESCFSIKYNITGEEQYQIDGVKYSVPGGSYLLLNSVEEGRVFIDSAKPVKGICISFSYSLLAEVIAANSSPEITDPDFFHFLTMPDFPEQVYNADATSLGNRLRLLSHTSPVVAPQFNREFYYGLAERILQDQAGIYKYYKALNAVKSNTRKDLLSRLLKGKEFIDHHFTARMDINTIARMANLSEYYFLRLFKTVFTTSPYSYLLKKRLDYAAYLLDSKDLPVAEVAYSSGFSDIHRFSKSFKKHFGLSPSDFRCRKK